MQSPVTTASNNRLTRQLRAVHKEQQSNRCSGQIFKEGDEIASGRKKDASNTTVIRVKVKGSRIRKSFIKTPDDRWFYCASSSLRNKIDLLHPFMKKTDELFFKAIKGFRHSSAGEKF